MNSIMSSTCELANDLQKKAAVFAAFLAIFATSKVARVFYARKKKRHTGVGVSEFWERTLLRPSCFTKPPLRVRRRERNCRIRYLLLPRSVAVCSGYGRRPSDSLTGEKMAWDERNMWVQCCVGKQPSVRAPRPTQGRVSGGARRRTCTFCLIEPSSTIWWNNAGMW